MTAIPLGAGGEFDRIRHVVEALGADAGPIGDDTAVVPIGVGPLVVSIDSAVEGVHFREEWLSAEEIGWRAAAAALSDLAAVAAVAAGLVVALTVPPGRWGARVTEVMVGVGAAARHAGTRVLGGDLTAGAVLSLAVTVFGHAATPLSRRGARPGDRLWVTGDLGGARAALMAWVAGRTPAKAARAAFAHPVPRLRAGQWLARHGATAMLDISDGLAGDALHLAAASAVGLEIDLEALPIHASVHAEARLAVESSPAFAATGGEDYELLVSMPAGFDGRADLEAATGTVIRPVGMVVAETGVRFRLDGDVVPLEGFRHPL